MVCLGGSTMDLSAKPLLQPDDKDSLFTGFCIGRDIPGLANFPCPDDDFVAPTPDDWKKVNDDYVNSMAA